MKKPRVSVVLPVYNVERYLTQCLDSILAQTFSDFELICVNDGSTDGSPSVLEAYARKDERIRIIHQNNQTLGAARNNGLAAARGKYVIFLDSDDFFKEDMLASCYRKAEETKADIVLFAFCAYLETKKTYSEKRGLRTELIDKTPVFSRHNYPDCLFDITYANVWTKLYRRRFLKRTKLRFQVLPNAEDEYFTFASMALAKRIAWIDSVFTCYRIGRPDSLESRKELHPLCFLEADTALFDELHNRGIYQELEIAFANRVTEHCRYAFWRMRNSPEALDAVKKELKNAFLPYTGILKLPDECFRNQEMLAILRGLTQQAADNQHNNKL